VNDLDLLDCNKDAIATILHGGKECTIVFQTPPDYKEDILDKEDAIEVIQSFLRSKIACDPLLDEMKERDFLSDATNEDFAISKSCMLSKSALPTMLSTGSSITYP